MSNIPPVARMGALPPVSTLNLKVNQSHTLTARVLDDAGNAMIMDKPTWVSSDDTVLKVARIFDDTAQAFVIGVAPGAATITISSKGLVKVITATVTVPVPTTLNIHPGPLP